MSKKTKQKREHRVRSINAYSCQGVAQNYCVSHSVIAPAAVASWKQPAGPVPDHLAGMCDFLVPSVSRNVRTLLPRLPLRHTLFVACLQANDVLILRSHEPNAPGSAGVQTSEKPREGPGKSRRALPFTEKKKKTEAFNKTQNQENTFPCKKCGR